MAGTEPVGPVQVLYKKDGRLHLNEEELTNILKDVQEMKLAIISIAGAFRTGKTFFLNFCLRYLLYLRKAAQAGGDNWLGDEPLTGFPWKNGKDADTEGIQMWGKPFVIKDSANQEIAVLLMDTQGLFGCNVESQENVEIFALSLLTSSVQIFNVQPRIGSDTLNRLKYFSDYASFFQLPEHSSTAFQKVIFLVRDWCNDYECAYGFNGGQKYLDSLLKVENNDSNELKMLKTGLRSCSSDLSCFLLPDPGKKVKCDQHFQGNLRVIDEDFVEHIKSFVPAVLAPDAIKVKEISTMPVHGRDFVKLFKTFVEAFQGNEPPEPQKLFEVFGKMTIDQASQNARYYYKRAMDKAFNSESCLDDEQLVILHSGKEYEALELFRNVTKMVDQDTVSESVRVLSRGFEEALEAYIKTNEERKPKKGIMHYASKVSEKLSKVGIVVGPAAVVGGATAITVTAIVAGPIGIGVAAGVGGVAAVGGAIATAASAHKIHRRKKESQERKDK